MKKSFGKLEIRAALFAALFCILAPHTIVLPVSPVGITLGSFLIYLAGMILGPRLGCISILLYLALGFVGLPVFSGYRAGAGVLFGPTGGYLIGYIPCVILVGLFTKKAGEGARALVRYITGMIVGTLSLYLIGTIWYLFVYTGDSSVKSAVAACVIPFLPLDGVKILVAAVLYKPMRRLRAM